MNLSEFDYTLDKSKIADRPSEKRGHSKLLVFENGIISDKVFYELPNTLTENDLIVFNNSKVIPARLIMKKETSGAAEILLVSPISEDGNYEKAIVEKGSSTWKCIIAGKNVKEGHRLIYDIEDVNLIGEILVKDGMYADVRLEYDNEITLAELLEEVGRIPLPPYMQRESDFRDSEDYQTVMAKYEGSVAAPTASLHYTPEIIEDLKAKKISTTDLTLHVGPGTFMPVKVDNPREHDMHSERISIDLSALKAIHNSLVDGKRIIASGTTSLRSIETLSVIAIDKAIGNNKYSNGIIEQFPYDSFEKDVDFKRYVIEGLEIMINEEQDIVCDSKIMIMPGHPYFLANGLITNFHLPKSTLLLLVSAFIGRENMWKVYNHALESDYRFLSYGDSSLLIR